MIVSKKVVLKYDSGDVTEKWFGVECDDCKTAIEPFSKDRDNAVRVWNMRLRSKLFGWQEWLVKEEMTYEQLCQKYEESNERDIG